MSPVVSVIIATYNRPDCLRVAIDSVLQQSVSDWELIVIGDGCDERTERVTQAVNDERVRYINLPTRFGEQSGPNSIAMELAKGKYIAFLNHDDVFLQDHLEHALRELERSQAEFFIGRSVFARQSDPNDEFGAIPIFSEINPPGRTGRDAFCGPRILFEPCSAWVVHTSTARRIGRWASATSMRRTPVQEWVLRAWRYRTRFDFSTLVTVLKVTTHYQYSSAAGNYSQESAEHRYVNHLLRKFDADAIRDIVLGELEDDELIHFRYKLTGTGYQFLLKLLTSKPMATFYRYTGIDGFELFCWIANREKGFELKKACSARTGAELPEAPDFEAILAEVQEDYQHPEPKPLEN